MLKKINRRGFLIGSSVGVLSISGGGIKSRAFAQAGYNDDVMVVVFLRGGMDGLTMLCPIAGPDRGYYESARPTLQVPASGPDAAIDLDGQFGLHPVMAPIHGIYQDGRAAFVRAAGIQNVVNRSHFDAQLFMDLGTPGVKTTTSGWLTRHLQSATNLPLDAVLTSLAVGGMQPASLLGSTDTLNVSDPDRFNFSNGPWLWRHAQRSAVRALYESESSWIHDAGVQSLNAMDIIDLNLGDDYTPSNGAVYPNGSFGEHLQVVAQMIKLDLGLQAATLDVGNWDTHEGQEYELESNLDELARGLEALYVDLNGSGASDHTRRLTVAVLSEFGRELEENGDRGTEHGYGNHILLLGGNVIGGLHGQWPGLAPGQLQDGTDLAVTTDFRRVLSEILIRRMGNPRIDVVFPGYVGYSPLGVVEGVDIPVGEPVFGDGFETGDISAWG